MTEQDLAGFGVDDDEVDTDDEAEVAALAAHTAPSPSGGTGAEAGMVTPNLKVTKHERAAQLSTLREMEEEVLSSQKALSSKAPSTPAHGAESDEDSPGLRKRLTSGAAIEAAEVEALERGRLAAAVEGLRRELAAAVARTAGMEVRA